MVEEYLCEQRLVDGGSIGAVLEAAKSYGVAPGFWLWQRSCSLREVEALLFVFVNLLMPKLLQYRD